MSNYIKEKESDVHNEYADLIKSVYETSIQADDKTVSELVDDIKTQLLKIMK